MAFLGEDDDFFGTAQDDHDDERYRECVDGHELHSGLARADAAALAERFRNVGFHETYEEYQEVRLQEGFEAGYRETFDVSVRIGEILGNLAMKAKRAENEKEYVGDEKHSKIQQFYETIAREVKDFLSTDPGLPEKAVDLDPQGLRRLETRIQTYSEDVR
jgi:hypothetical protein